MNLLLGRMMRRQCPSGALGKASTDADPDSGSGGNALHRVLGLWDLVAFGVGGTIGAGIFVSIGVGEVQAGPALFLSFALAAFSCALSGLCYCEMASRVPAAGSSYSYTYAVLGEFCAFLVGIVLCIDNVISAAAVARAWAAYVRIVLPFLPQSVFGDIAVSGSGGIVSFSLLSGTVCIILGILLLAGTKQTSSFNKLSTIFNCAILFLFILAGLPMAQSSNWTPFMPHGVGGVVRGASRVFFAYLGFDVVNCLAEETGGISRQLVPKAIILTIVLSGLLYVLVALAFVGLAPISQIDLEAPLASSFDYRGYTALGYLVGIGAVGNTFTSVLSTFLIQPRILLRMSADGLLPKWLSVINDKGVPYPALLLSVSASALTAFIIDFETLADLVSVASLISFSLVCCCCIFVRLRPIDTVEAPSVTYTAESTTVGDETDFPNSASDELVAHMDGGTHHHGVSFSRLVIVLAIYGLMCLITSIGMMQSWAGIAVGFLAAFTVIAGIACYIVFRQIENSLPISQQNHSATQHIFIVPWVPAIPLFGIFVNTYLLCGLPLAALIRAAVVFIFSAVLYVLYAQHHSVLEPSTESRTNVKNVSLGAPNAELSALT